MSLLPSISKILENVIFNRLNSFLEINNVLYEGQYGFRKNRNTIDAVTDFLGNLLTDLDKGQYSIGFFMDLSKAFDTINHKI